jgi:hypothetical protein
MECISVSLSMALQLFGPWPLFQILNLIHRSLATSWPPVQGVLPTVPDQETEEIQPYAPKAGASFQVWKQRGRRKSYAQSVGLLGRVISPLQGCYLHTEQHKQNKRTDRHASIGIRTHDLSVRAGEDSSCLRPRGHLDRRMTCVSDTTRTPKEGL